MENQSKLPNDVYQQALHEVIEKKLNKPFSEFDIKCTEGSAKGDGYAGELFRVQVHEKDTKELKFSLIGKFPPQSAVRREMFSNEAFLRENMFYDDVFPMYRKFQEEKGIDVDKDGFHEVPDCYKCLMEENYEGIFMEDLKVSGYDLYDRLTPVTANNVFLVMKALGKMHAIFYALKDQKPELVKKYCELPEIFFMEGKTGIGNPLDPWFENMKEPTREVVALTENSDLIGKIDEILKHSFSDLLKNILDRKKTEPYGTLCHGDCWNNNMMFRFDEKGTPKELKLLDFQVLRYASPVCDLVYYIFGATEKPLRDKYYGQFMDCYYEELSSFMKRLGSNPDKLYPRHVFENHLELFGHFGMVMAMISIPVMTSTKDEIPDFEKMAEDLKKKKETGQLDNSSFSFGKPKNQKKYEERLLGIVRDMYLFGYLEKIFL